MKKFVFKRSFKAIKHKIEILEILSHEHSMLNKEIQNEVIFPLNLNVENSIDKLVDTLRFNNGVYEKKGVAIAANQVGLNLRFFLMADYLANPHDILKRIEIICNPRIISQSTELVEEDEGCLSIPEFLAYVVRSKTILVEYQNIQGIKVKKELDGMRSRIFQHELDHLNGIHMLKKAKKIEQNPLYKIFMEKQNKIKEEINISYNQ